MDCMGAKLNSARLALARAWVRPVAAAAACLVLGGVEAAEAGHRSEPPKDQGKNHNDDKNSKEEKSSKEKEKEEGSSKEDGAGKDGKSGSEGEQGSGKSESAGEKGADKSVDKDDGTRAQKQGAQDNDKPPETVADFFNRLIAPPKPAPDPAPATGTAIPAAAKTPAPADRKSVV